MYDSIKKILWGNFDFRGLKDNHEFTEDSLQVACIPPCHGLETNAS